MNKNQINRKEMLDSVISYLNLNATKWSSIPKVAEVKINLTDINMQIEAAQKAQQAAQVHVGISKKLLKGIISEKADILNDVVEAYASINNMPELESRMTASTNTFVKMRNEDFIPAVREVISETEKYQDTLTAEYGLSSEQLIDIKEDFNRFMELKGMPRAYQVASRQATSDLETLFSLANEVLSAQLDKVMKIFKRRDANFYNGYIASREILDD